MRIQDVEKVRLNHPDKIPVCSVLNVLYPFIWFCEVYGWLNCMLWIVRNFLNND